MARIVVLDDQPDICLSIQYCLTHIGHTVEIAHTGDEAIDFAYLFEPDILITDWNLHSDYDGLEVAEAFHAANKEIKDFVIKSTKEKTCACTTRNPSGKCCLKDFPK